MNRRGFMQRIATLGACAAVAATAAACSHGSSIVPPSTSTLVPPNPAAPGWILTYNAFKELSADSNASYLFNNPKTYVIVSTSHVGSLASWNVSLMADYKSYAAMQQAFADGTVPAGIKAVMYDDESWDLTPPAEQQDPAKYIQLAAQLVHSHNLLFVATPAADLAGVLDAGGVGDQYTRYLHLGLAGIAAKYSDVLNIQAQGEEASTTAYDTFLTSAIAQAKAANPNIIIYAGISTARAADAASAMTAAVAATQSLVTGYWLNIPGGGGGDGKASQSSVSIATQVIDNVSTRLQSGVANTGGQ